MRLLALLTIPLTVLVTSPACKPSASASSVKSVTDGKFDVKGVTSPTKQKPLHVRSNHLVFVADIHMTVDDSAHGIKAVNGTEANMRAVLAAATTEAAKKGGTVVLNGDLLDRANFFEGGKKNETGSNVLSEDVRRTKILEWVTKCRDIVEGTGNRKTGVEFVYNFGNHELPENADRSADVEMGARIRTALEKAGITVLSENPHQPVPIITPNGEMLAVGHVQQIGTKEGEVQFHSHYRLDKATGKISPWLGVYNNLSYDGKGSGMTHVASDNHSPAQSRGNYNTGAATEITAPDGGKRMLLVMDTIVAQEPAVTQLMLAPGEKNVVKIDSRLVVPDDDRFFKLDPAQTEALTKMLAEDVASMSPPQIDPVAEKTNGNEEKDLLNEVAEKTEGVATIEENLRTLLTTDAAMEKVTPEFRERIDMAIRGAKETKEGAVDLDKLDREFKEMSEALKTEGTEAQREVMERLIKEVEGKREK